MDGDDGVQAVVLAAQQGFGLEPVDLAAERTQLGAQLTRYTFPFARQLQISSYVAELARQAVVGVQHFLQPAPAREYLLGSFRVLPEIGKG